MKKDTPLTRKDIDEVIGILKEFMNEVSIRFDNVDARFDAIDARFDAMDKRVNKVETDTILVKKVIAL